MNKRGKAGGQIHNLPLRGCLYVHAKARYPKIDNVTQLVLTHPRHQYFLATTTDTFMPSD